MSCTHNVLGHSVVVFSANYLPLTRINIKRAIVLLLAGKAEPVHFMSSATTTWTVHAPSLVLQVPEYIRLTTSNRDRLWKAPSVSRREVLKRDRHTCQYCGSTKHLTVDHVLPRSRGGTDTWENVVTACTTCNGRKGNRTPEEAKMPLRTQPKAPVHPVLAFAEEFWRHQGEAMQPKPNEA
ncbi:HNH endonuclease [Geitlerinema sp. PCC 9228]|uniref:HNH endonuclease n=1 Tax=Geitlerinema sp. PCC 9228 TaxID=111611 RepID=UPI0008F9A835|nr:HNH endonuclease [Geitlerinema sp. PCC 9228]